jgi:diadenosine tetraphosphatase ApaH/serine/threonine PP2A family protein phosphatase
MPARVAVISDVHANLAALEAVLAAVEAEGVDEVWCLGDTVGYGPRPNECCARVRDTATVCLVGNHDLVALGAAGVDLDEFNLEAAAAARWTAAALDDEARAFLSGLRPEARRHGVALFHASARDPVWEYVLTTQAALASFEAAPEPLLLVGHSHVALALALEGARVDGGPARAGREVRLDGPRLLLNPGSVGQPRDGDPRASWLLLDTGEWRAEWRRTKYDIAGAAAAIRAARLPDSLAERLEYGQ